MILSSLEPQIKDIQKKKWRHPFFYFFIPLSFLYRLGALINRWMYETGIRKQVHVSSKVISIGNLVAGGGGKTSLTQLLCEGQENIAICARNLGLSRETNRVHTLKKNTIYRAEEVGDEPLLHSLCLPDVSVYVARKKSDAALEASKRHTVIVVDDGMQHHRLKKDIEVVCINAQRPFDNGWLLPAGLMREPKKILSRADFIALTNAEAYDPFLEEEIKKYTNAPQFGVAYSTEEKLPKKAIAFCAIGYPEGFFSLLRKEGVDLLEEITFPDHTFFSEKSLRSLAEKARALGVKEILCTEKDFLKILPPLQSELPIRSVKVILSVRFGKKNFDKLLSVFQ